MARDAVVQICDLLKSPDAELQCAAARVLGALKTSDATVRQALVGALGSGNQMVVSYAVDALGRMGDPAVIPQLVAAFAAAPPARDHAIGAVAGFGAAAWAALRPSLKAKQAAVRRGVLEVFSRSAAPEALDDLLEGVLDADEEVVQFATAAVRRRVETMDEKGRGALLAKLRKLLARPAAAKSAPALTALMKLLGFLRLPDAVPVLLGHLDRKLPPPVRKNALVSLEHLALGEADAKALVTKLLPLLAEADFPNVVGPALSVLGKVKVPKAFSAKMLALRKSPHPSVRAWAVRALGSTGTAQAADALVATLASEDFRDREQAASALRANPEYATRLASELEKAKDLTHAWTIAEILRSYRQQVPKPVAKKLLARGTALLAKQDEERAKAFVEVARFAAPDLAKAGLLQGGTAWLKKKRFEVAEGFLRHLERDDLATPDGLYALALARFKRGGASLDPAMRGKNPSLPILVRLLRRGDFPLAKRLHADRKLLTPADLLYLGFHFVEQEGAAERQFGADALKVLARAFPKSAEARSAKQRLNTEGL